MAHTPRRLCVLSSVPFPHGSAPAVTAAAVPAVKLSAVSVTAVEAGGSCGVEVAAPAITSAQQPRRQWPSRVSVTAAH